VCLKLKSLFYEILFEYNDNPCILYLYKCMRLQYVNSFFPTYNLDCRTYVLVGKHEVHPYSKEMSSIWRRCGHYIVSRYGHLKHRLQSTKRSSTV